MARPTIPDPEKRMNVGLRMHPVTLQHLDELVEFFQGLRQANPMLPFGFPESRTDVVEFLLREGVRDFITHVLAWYRIGTHRELPNDSSRMVDSSYWNMMFSSVRLERTLVPDSWLAVEWPLVTKGKFKLATSEPPVQPPTAASPTKRSRKPRNP